MLDKLFEENKRIRDEADEILHDRNLLQIVQAYGKTYVSGSYALDLMTWRDLDIYLDEDFISEERFFQLGSQLCAALSPVRMQFRNERIAKTKGLPQGLYWGIYLGNEREGAWKIDIWAITSKECERLLNYCQAIKEQLNDSVSGTILSIKSQCWQDPQYRHTYDSSHIYEAVLKGGVRDLEGFWNYLDR